MTNSRAARRRMQRDANRLAMDAQRFADMIKLGGPYSEDAERLLKQSVRLVLCAARLDAQEEEEN